MRGNHRRRVIEVCPGMDRHFISYMFCLYLVFVFVETRLLGAVYENENPDKMTIL